MTHMHASRVSSFIICMYSTYCTYYHCLLQSTVLYVHTSAHAKGILFMPKASSSILRSESVQIKPLQRLPTVCTYHKSYCTTPKGGHHIRPTLLPRHMLHLILINFADNLAYLCFFQFKSAFEQIWVRNLDWVVCPQSLSSRDRAPLLDRSLCHYFQESSNPQTSGADHQNLKNQFVHLLHI